MIAPADVLKVKCKFVKDVATYLNAKKYSIDVEKDAALCSYLQVLQARLEDCLDDDAACTVRDAAKSYKDADCTALDAFTCEEQLPITLAVYDSTTCNYIATLSNALGLSSLAEFSVDNDSQNVAATIDSTLLSTCEGILETNTFENQQSYTDRPIGSTRLGPSGSFGGYLEPTSYIKTLRVYETDSFGVFQPTPIDLDLDPDTSDYYGPSVPFPDLASVTPSDLQMGASYDVFIEAFTTLMNNVSLVRYGDTGKHDILAWPTNNGTYLNIGSAPKHNPSGNWFGINRADAYIKVATASGDRTSKVVGFLSPYSVINGTATYNVSCGAITLNVPNTSLLTPLDYAQTSFNKIVLSSTYSSTGIPFTVDNSPLTCPLKVLMATYDESLVTSVFWLDPNDDEISTTNTAQASEAGTYTFTANMANGCQLVQTITI